MGTWEPLAKVDIVIVGRSSISYDYTSDVPRNEADVSAYTGNLLIKSLQQKDEGMYRCTSTKQQPVEIRLTILGKWYYKQYTPNEIKCFSTAHDLTLKIYLTHPWDFALYFFFLPLGGPPAPSLIGLTAPVVIGQQSTISCAIDFFWTANVTFAWAIQNQHLGGYHTEVITLRDNIATFSSVLQNNFTRADDGGILTCSIKAATGSDTYEHSTAGPVHLYCKHESHIYNKFW